jgi:hypothetical protein
VPNTFLKSIQVFISSPSDVQSERDCAVRMLERLNKMSHIRSRFAFVPAAYETEAPPIIGKPPQQVIKEYMLPPNQADLFVCILWRRMGTPFKDRSSGEQFRSGTDYEFTAAYRANQQSGAPFILLYRCTRAAEGSVDSDQNRAVQDFFKKFTLAKSAWKGLFKTYQTVQDFEDQLFQDLDHVISNNLLRALQPSVSIRGDLCNDGWLVTFLISEPVREIFYARGSSPFKSTGHQSIRDNQTGSRMAHYQLTLSLRRGKHVFRVKYLDINGETKGPFDLNFDTEAERLRDAKETLEHLNPEWIEFRRPCQGTLLAYFGTLLDHKDAIRRIQYSIDNESLSCRLRFKPWKSSGVPVYDQDQDPLTVPRDAKFVAVQVTYSDNSKSEIKKFSSRGAYRG